MENVNLAVSEEEICTQCGEGKCWDDDFCIDCRVQEEWGFKYGVA